MRPPPLQGVAQSRGIKVEHLGFGLAIAATESLRSTPNPSGQREVMLDPEGAPEVNFPRFYAERGDLPYGRDAGARNTGADRGPAGDGGSVLLKARHVAADDVDEVARG